MLIRVLLSVILCISSIAVFGGEPAAKVDAAPATAAASGPKAQEFAKVSKEFNDLIANLTELQTKYVLEQQCNGKGGTQSEVRRRTEECNRDG